MSQMSMEMLPLVLLGGFVVIAIVILQLHVRRAGREPQKQETGNKKAG